ncbi:MAG: Tfp pilus assembly protein FimT/FimU [Thiohalomonadales bacterium]
MGNSKLNAGFTLIELVVIIVIAGILVAYIVPRISSRTTFDERVFKDEIINTARFAQQLAMMRGRNSTIRFHLNNTTKNYGIDSRQGGGAYSWLSHANSEAFPLPFPDGISTLPVNLVIAYDALGNIVGGISQAITITGLASSTICIDASGFAHEGAC